MNTANACCTRKNSATATVLELLQWAVKAQDPARDTSALATARDALRGGNVPVALVWLDEAVFLLEAQPKHPEGAPWVVTNLLQVAKAARSLLQPSPRCRQQDTTMTTTTTTVSPATQARDGFNADCVDYLDLARRFLADAEGKEGARAQAVQTALLATLSASDAQHETALVADAIAVLDQIKRGLVAENTKAARFLTLVLDGARAALARAQACGAGA